MKKSTSEKFIGPMITAVGIILGFLLSFTATWVSQLPNDADWSDGVIGLGLFLSIFLNIITMYRILDNSVPEDKEDTHFRITLRYFMSGLSVALAAFILSTVQVILTPLV